MDLFTLFTLAVGLSMDAFAVSICKGLSMEKLSIKNMAVVGLWFGGLDRFVFRGIPGSDAGHRLSAGSTVQG